MNWVKTKNPKIFNFCIFMKYYYPCGENLIYLVSYLSGQAAQSQSPDFTIPFNRQQLADYLSVDRSALSNELGKMQRDGLLQVNKNPFILKEKE